MILIDGKPYPSGAPELHLLNRSLRYGDGLFETIRVRAGKALFLPDHFDRLLGGMDLLGFVYERQIWQELLLEAVKASLEGNDLRDNGRLRLHVYRKGEGAYLPLENSPGYILEGVALKEDPYEAPGAVSLVDYPGPILPIFSCKTANSLPYILAASFARKQGADDALLHVGNYLAETTRANLFLVRKKQILTPPLKHGALDGIMRRQVFKLCRELKLPLKEQGLTSKDLRQAEEAFVTNTIRGIQPVVRYGDVHFPLSGNRMTLFLQQCLRQWVEKS